MSDELQHSVQSALILSGGTDIADLAERAAALEVWEKLKLAWWCGAIGFCQRTAFAWLTTAFLSIIGIGLLYELVARLRHIRKQRNDASMELAAPLIRQPSFEYGDGGSPWPQHTSADWARRSCTGRRRASKNLLDRRHCTAAYGSTF